MELKDKILHALRAKSKSYRLVRMGSCLDYKYALTRDDLQYILQLLQAKKPL